MKKRKNILIGVIIIVILVFGYKLANEIFIKIMVWNNASHEEKMVIIGDWRNATIEKRVADTRFMFLIDKKYSGKKVYHVIFRTTNESLLGPIGAYVDPLTRRIIGGDYRE